MANVKLLRWRCRRGMKELDKLLEHYLLNHFENASSGEQEAFEALLTLPDPLLFDYLLAEQKPDKKSLQNIVNQIIGLKKTLQ